MKLHNSTEARMKNNVEIESICAFRPLYLALFVC